MTSPVTAVNGVATFADLKVLAITSDLRVRASATLAGASSATTVDSVSITAATAVTWTSALVENGRLGQSPTSLVVKFTPTTALASGNVITITADKDVFKYSVFVPVAANIQVVLTGSDEILLDSPMYNDLVDGDAMIYLNGGGSDLGGLQNNQISYVKKTASSTKIKLYSSRNAALNEVGSGRRDLFGLGNNNQKFQLIVPISAIWQLFWL